jgi:CRISPR/Cas system CSM-associated protein Csm3 (group 7 of RAMP superfamily)
MPRTEIEWTWVTESPLHCGSGLSRPGYADRLVQRDAQGVVIPGDAVKGALRLSAEQVLAWLGKPQEDRYEGNAEPRANLLRALFGGSGRHHYRAARSESNVPVFRVPATAIDRSTGRARDDTLRTIEVVAGGAELSTSCTLWLEGSAEWRNAAVTLFLAALAATESIGGKAGIGWGRLRVKGLKLDGKALPPSQAIPDNAGDTIREQLEKSAIRTGSPTKSAPNGKLAWCKLILTLREPTSVAAKPEVANKVLTLDSIPATVLRGALREAWLADGWSDTELAGILGDTTRWTPALPAVGGKPSLPTPMCFRRLKDETGFDGKNGIHNALFSAPPHELGGERVQWLPLEARWLRFGEKRKLSRHAAADVRETRMHVARNYTTGSKREGALFAREALSANRCLVAFARVPQDTQWPEKIYVGKRRSTGHGEAYLTRETADPPTEWSQAATDGTVYVQLLSPALVRDEHGYPLRSLNAVWWAGRAGIGASDLTSCESFTATRSIPGWMMDWGHGRAAVTYLAPGSVWKLVCSSVGAAEKLRAALKGLADEGLGERAHEGFGWITVDPPWLRQEKPPVKREEEDTKPGGRARIRWPGCEDIDPKELEAICSSLGDAHHPKLNLTRDVGGPLQELARRARDLQTAAQCKDLLETYCDEMSKREPPRKWEKLKVGTEARTLLGRSANNPKLFRFTIEALLIRASSAGEN